MLLRSLSPAIVLIFMTAGAQFSCSPADSGSTQTDTPAKNTTVSRWHQSENAAFVAIADDELDEPLQAAIANAHESLDQARKRWAAAEEPVRARWSIKWTAPIVDGGVEYVWVKPFNWSEFRVEGYLLNEPRQALETGSRAGDVVSFPIEDVADWVYWKDKVGAGEKDGGYTIDVLSKAFGEPSQMSN